MTFELIASPQFSIRWQAYPSQNVLFITIYWI